MNHLNYSNYFKQLTKKIIQLLISKWWIVIITYLQYQVWFGTGGWYDYYRIREKIVAQEEINLILQQNNLKNTWILQEAQHQQEYRIHYGTTE